MESPTASPHAFLFSVEKLQQHKTFGYDKPALKAVFKAILQADRENALACQVFVGDLLIWNIAEGARRVEYRPDGPPLEAGRVREMIGLDRELYPLIVWDFCDSVADRWNTIDLRALPVMFRDDVVFGVTLSTFPHRLREPVQAQLELEPSYLGAFDLDDGDVVQSRTVVNIHMFDLVHGSLEFDRWQSEDAMDPPTLHHPGEWHQDVPFASVRYRELDEQPNVPVWSPSELSDRGRAGIDRINAARQHTHMDRLIMEAADLDPGPKSSPFRLERSMMPRAASAVVPEDKLRNYALSFTSPRGKSKAKFFRDVLAIEADDWLYLADQLRSGIASATDLEKVRSDEYGIQYHASVPVKGRNGVVVPIVCAWIVREGESPQLTTVYPDKKARLEDLSALQEPMVLPVDLDGEERWERLWSIAARQGRLAASEKIPTPMLIGGEWITEGKFGSATVAVPDARKGFARWLVRSNNAHAERGKGAVVICSETSADRSEAYANAFADVLRANGIECKVATFLN